LKKTAGKVRRCEGRKKKIFANPWSEGQAGHCLAESKQEKKKKKSSKKLGEER